MEDSTTSNPPAEPTHFRLDGLAALQNATGQVIGLAATRLCIFDFDLADGGYNSPARQGQLRDFLLASRASRLEIALHDTDYVTRYCPRLMTLITQYSHAVQIRRISAEARTVNDPFVVADGTHYLHRFHYNTARGLLALQDNAGARSLIHRFEEIWALSEPAVFATTLGL